MNGWGQKTKIKMAKVDSRQRVPGFKTDSRRTRSQSPQDNPAYQADEGDFLDVEDPSRSWSIDSSGKSVLSVTNNSDSSHSSGKSVLSVTNNSDSSHSSGKSVLSVTNNSDSSNSSGELHATPPGLSVVSTSPGKDHFHPKLYERIRGNHHQSSSVLDELRIGLPVGTLCGANPGVSLPQDGACREDDTTHGKYTEVEQPPPQRVFPASTHPVTLYHHSANPFIVPPNRTLARSTSMETFQSEETYTSKNHRLCCFVCILFFVSGVIVGSIALVDYLRAAEASGFKLKSVADVTLRLDDTYRPSMSDNTSEEFQYFQKKFCYNVEESVKHKLDVTNCTILSMSRGSVIVRFLLQFISTAEKTTEELGELFTTSKTKGGDRAQLGLLILFPDDVQVRITSERTLDDARPQPRSSTFDCSQTDKLYLPLPYTSQGFCGEYQRCNNGKSELFSCADGQEFAYTSIGDRIVCAAPSNSTYCGRQGQMPAATTSTAEPSTATTHVLTSEASTHAETSTAEYPCPDIPSLDRLYTCPQNETAFIPRRYTYPNYCDVFAWCLDGQVFDFDGKCANGTHYSMQADPCIWQGSPNTFCSIMKRCSS